MGVGWDAIAVRDFDPEDERPLFARIAYEDGDPPANSASNAAAAL
jgi:hypothetical protein